MASRALAHAAGKIRSAAALRSRPLSGLPPPLGGGCSAALLLRGSAKRDCQASTFANAMSGNKAAVAAGATSLRAMPEGIIIGGFTKGAGEVRLDGRRYGADHGDVASVRARASAAACATYTDSCIWAAIEGTKGADGEACRGGASAVRARVPAAADATKEVDVNEYPKLPGAICVAGNAAVLSKGRVVIITPSAVRALQPDGTGVFRLGAAADHGDVASGGRAAVRARASAAPSATNSRSWAVDGLPRGFLLSPAAFCSSKPADRNGGAAALPNSANRALLSGGQYAVAVRARPLACSARPYTSSAGEEAGQKCITCCQAQEHFIHAERQAARRYFILRKLIEETHMENKSKLVRHGFMVVLVIVGVMCAAGAYAIKKIKETTDYVRWWSATTLGTTTEGGKSVMSGAAAAWDGTANAASQAGKLCLADSQGDRGLGEGA